MLPSSCTESHYLRKIKVVAIYLQCLSKYKLIHSFRIMNGAKADTITVFVRGNHGELHLLTNLSWSSNTNEIFSQMNARTGVATMFSYAPATSLYIFHQALMRNHLLKCFEQKKLEPFPVFKERRVSTCAKTMTVKVYCYCRSVYDGEKMVECNGGCGEWYHTKCISTPVHRNKKWFCKNCSMI